MTTYEDLTPYEYRGRGLTGSVLNVGWLGAESRYDTAEVDPRVIPVLLQLSLARTNVTRGFHHCELCEVRSPIEVPFKEAPRGCVVLGHAEIHVPGKDGVTYAAPNLIIHYLDAHKYRPPAEFIDAVVALA